MPDLADAMADFMGPEAQKPGLGEAVQGFLGDNVAEAIKPAMQEQQQHEQYSANPFSAPPELRLQYTLQKAHENELKDRQASALRADPATQYVAQGMPFVSPILGRIGRSKYKEASDRYAANEYGDDYQGQIKREDDARRIASYEQDQQAAGAFQRDHPFAANAAQAQALIGENLIGGALLKAVSPTVAASALIPAMTKGGAKLAAATAATPSLYLSGASDSDVTNFARGMVLNNILGSLGKPVAGAVGRVPTALGRMGANAAVGAAAMPAEQQFADAVTSAADEFLPDSMKFNTHYGLIGDLMKGKDGEAGRQFATEAITGAVFAAAHAPGSTRENKAQTAQLELAKYNRRLQEMARKGMSSQRAFDTVTKEMTQERQAQQQKAAPAPPANATSGPEKVAPSPEAPPQGPDTPPIAPGASKAIPESENAAVGARPESHPAFKAVAEAFPGAKESSRPNEMQADFEGRKVYFEHDPARNVMRIDFTDADAGKAGVPAEVQKGSLALGKALRGLVRGLKETGAGIEYDAKDQARASAAKLGDGKPVKSRADMYAKLLAKEGYTQTGGPGVDKSETYTWKPAEQVAKKVDAAGGDILGAFGLKPAPGEKPAEAPAAAQESAPPAEAPAAEAPAEELSPEAKAWVDRFGKEPKRFGRIPGSQQSAFNPATGTTDAWRGALQDHARELGGKILKTEQGGEGGRALIGDRWYETFKDENGQWDVRPQDPTKKEKASLQRKQTMQINQNEAAADLEKRAAEAQELGVKPEDYHAIADEHHADAQAQVDAHNALVRDALTTLDKNAKRRGAKGSAARLLAAKRQKGGKGQLEDSVGLEKDRIDEVAEQMARDHRGQFSDPDGDKAHLTDQLMEKLHEGKRQDADKNEAYEQAYKEIQAEKELHDAKADAGGTHTPAEIGESVRGGESLARDQAGPEAGDQAGEESGDDTSFPFGSNAPAEEEAQAPAQAGDVPVVGARPKTVGLIDKLIADGGLKKSDLAIAQSMIDRLTGEGELSDATLRPLAVKFGMSVEGVKKAEVRLLDRAGSQHETMADAFAAQREDRAGLHRGRAEGLHAENRGQEKLSPFEAEQQRLGDKAMNGEAPTNAELAYLEKLRQEDEGKGRRGRRAGQLSLPTEGIKAELDRAVNMGREAAGQSFPATTRLSKPTSAKLGEVANVRRFAADKDNLLYDQIFGKADKAAADRLMTTLQETRFRAAGSPHTFVGGPELPDNAAYKATLASPEYKEFTDNWKKYGTPWFEEKYREAAGQAPGSPILSATQLPDLPYTAIPLEHSQAPLTGSAPKGNLGAVKASKLGATKAAGLEGENGYVTDAREILTNMISKRAQSATEATYFRTAINDGVGKFVEKGTPAEEGWRNVDAVRPPANSPFGQGEKLWRVKEETYNDTIRAFGTADPYKPLPLTGPFLKVLNAINVSGVTEFIAHTANIFTAPFKGVRIQDMLRETVNVTQGDMKAREQAVELARIDALARGGRGHGLLGGGKMDPTSWAGKALDVIDTATRIAAGQAYDRMTGTDKTQAGRRDYINQVAGNYNVRSQSELVRFLRETQINPYATASVHFWANSLRTFMFADPGVKGSSALAGMQLRGMVILRNAAILAAVPIANYLRWGRADGSDDTPLFGLKIGEDAQGRARYLDIGRLTPWGRGAKYAGAWGFAESQRHEGTTGERIDKSIGDMARPASNMTGPIGHAVHVLATGKDSMGRQVAAYTPGRSNVPARLTAAAFGTNPLTEAVRPEITGVLNRKVLPPLGAGPIPEPPERKSTGDRLLGALGPLALKRGSGPGGQAMSDVYELKRQFLRSEGKADDSAPHASAIAGLKAAALSDDKQAFDDAKAKYLDDARKMGRSPQATSQALQESLKRLNPTEGMNLSEKNRFWAGLTSDQRDKVLRAAQHAATIKGKIGEMWLKK